MKNILPNIDYTYHNYRDSSFDSMNRAIEYLDHCGIQTIRMGQITEKGKIHEKCIDFSKKGYDEFVDLMLHRNLKFFIGSASGIIELSHFFGRPTVWMAPYYPLVEPNLGYLKEDLCIFQRIYNVNEKRELSLRELFFIGIGYRGNPRGEYFLQQGLKLIPFSEEDILDVVTEMNERLDGKWKDENSDIELHNRFKQMLNEEIEKHGIAAPGVYPIRIATSYLRRYKYLFEK